MALSDDRQADADGGAGGRDRLRQPGADQLPRVPAVRAGGRRGDDPLLVLHLQLLPGAHLSVGADSQARQPAGGARRGCGSGWPRRSSRNHAGAAGGDRRAHRCWPPGRSRRSCGARSSTTSPSCGTSRAASTAPAISTCGSGGSSRRTWRRWGSRCSPRADDAPPFRDALLGKDCVAGLTDARDPRAADPGKLRRALRAAGGGGRADGRAALVGRDGPRRAAQGSGRQAGGDRRSPRSDWPTRRSSCSTPTRRRRSTPGRRRPICGGLTIEDLPEPIVRPFREVDGTLGRVALIYPVRVWANWDGHALIRMSDTFKDVRLPGGRAGERRRQFLDVRGDAALDLARRAAGDRGRSRRRRAAGGDPFQERIRSTVLGADLAARPGCSGWAGPARRWG